MFLHICAVDLGSQNSALLVVMVKNVKFDHDFETFFGYFDDFHDRVHARDGCTKSDTHYPNTVLDIFPILEHSDWVCTTVHHLFK